MVRFRVPAAFAPLLLLVTIAGVSALACGGGALTARDGVTVEPLTATATTTVRAIGSATPLLGGKPAAPRATAAPTDTSVPVEPTTAPATQAVATSVPATATPPPSGPPATGRWIEIDVTALIVRLMDGATVVREIGPIGVGVQVDTGEYLSTQTGLFAVHNKIEGLAYDAPYDTYISHWVGFDTAKDNGFHSFLKDAAGNVVDASTGRVSNGCIRTGEAEAIFAWAEIGMPVWVHA